MATHGFGNVDVGKAWHEKQLKPIIQNITRARVFIFGGWWQWSRNRSRTQVAFSRVCPFETVYIGCKKHKITIYYNRKAPINRGMMYLASIYSAPSEGVELGPECKAPTKLGFPFSFIKLTPTCDKYIYIYHSEHQLTSWTTKKIPMNHSTKVPILWHQPCASVDSEATTPLRPHRSWSCRSGDS